MGLFYKSIFLLSLISIIGYANEGKKECFKSIHQVELEAHQDDTLKHDTLLQSKEVKTDSMYNQNYQIRTLINSSLLIVIFLVLIVAITIFIILRRAQKVRKE